MFENIDRMNQFQLGKAQAKDKEASVAIVKTMLEMCTKASREGILALEEYHQINEDDLLCLLTGMVTDGVDRHTIDDVVNLRLASAPDDVAYRFKLFIVWLGTRLLQSSTNSAAMAFWFTEAFGRDSELLGAMQQKRMKPEYSYSFETGPNTQPESEAFISKPFQYGDSLINTLCTEDVKMATLLEQGDIDMAIAALCNANDESVWKMFSTIQTDMRYLELLHKLYGKVSLHAKESDETRHHFAMIQAALSALSPEKYKTVVDLAKTTDKELAERITTDTYKFSDIVTIDDRAFQRILREVNNMDLVHAVSHASKDIVDKVQRNMSENGAGLFRENLAYYGNTSKENAFKAQRKILLLISRLVEYGEITISK